MLLLLSCYGAPHGRFVASAHYATECLQPHAGPTATALVTKYLTNLSWGYALPASCDSNVMKLLVGVTNSNTRPWNEYHILSWVAAAAAAITEQNATLGSQDVGHCPGPRYYHRYFRADAYGAGIPGALYASFAGESLLTDHASRAEPDVSTQSFEPGTSSVVLML
jgi:hypothetical protein